MIDSEDIKYYLETKGGTHLEVIRSWIQKRFTNGSHVTWGYRDVLYGNPVTVLDLEEVALLIATRVIGDNFIEEDRICAFCDDCLSSSILVCKINHKPEKAIAQRYCEGFGLRKGINLLSID